MSKGIIVLDMPECCVTPECRVKCPLAWNAQFCSKFSPKGLNTTNGEWEEIYAKGIRPDWCPIKPLPEKLPEYELVSYTDGDGNISKRTKLNPENCGWNACIDYMLGGTNGKE